MPQYILGVDEAGRGPLAGPVSVGVVMVQSGFDIGRAFPGLRDSKLLSPQKRDELFELLQEYVRQGTVAYCVRFSSHSYIDERGITHAIRRAVYSGIKRVAPDPTGVHIYLDGLLHAPEQYSQETVIGGDDRIPLISLASVAAKVRRDRVMKRLAKKFPQYGFDQHKGYGTDMHRDALKAFGLCDLHRKSYCKTFLEVV